MCGANPWTGSLVGRRVHNRLWHAQCCRGIGTEPNDLGIALLTFGLLLAVYDVAELVLKPLRLAQ